MPPSELALFVSHSSADIALAKALVELFEKALKLSARMIRCTSLDGYRLPVGADTDQQLRREIFSSHAFIGILTPASIRSAYVLFELGARWGARKHLAPVLARGADATLLARPISGLNALRIDKQDQVRQLVEDIGDFLQVGLEPMASFQDAVNNVVTAAAQPSSSPQATTSSEQRQTSGEVRPEPEMHDDEIKLLQLLVRKLRPDEDDIVRHLGIHGERAKYYINRLQSRALISLSSESINTRPNYHGRTTLGQFRTRQYYCLTQKGRELLITKGLL